MSGSTHKWIMHVDMDAFFASVEQRDHPEYRGKPLVVGALPGRRGVVATCSYEARAFGIRSAMPISEAYRRCRHAIYLRPDMPRYTESSRRVLRALGNISPLVEAVSIDEAYLDISGLQRLFGEPAEIGRRCKHEIYAATGLKCSVGIGPNRLVAKLASDYRKPDGLVVVAPEQVQDFLDPLPVSRLRGVGDRLARSVRNRGIEQVAELRGYSLAQLQRQFGDKAGRLLHDQARGLASDQVGERVGRRSISKESTFHADLSDPQVLRDRLRRLAAGVGRTARREGLEGRVVTLKIRLQDFRTHTRQRRLSEPLNGDADIFRISWELYQGSGFSGRPLRLLGVGLSDWGESGGIGDLFDDGVRRERNKRLYDTLDKATAKFGAGALSLGVDAVADSTAERRKPTGK